MLTDGIRMSPAQHCALTHPISMAYAPLPNAAGTRVYVICGWQGGARRRDMGAEAWRAEVARRAGVMPPTDEPSPPGARCTQGK